MKTAPPDIIVYGGSFDPPHQGHVDCVYKALETWPESKLIIFPGYQPAGARGLHKTPDTPFEDRLAMARLAFGEAAGRIEISALEKDLPVPNYTVNTLKRFVDMYPDARISLMMGLDQFKEFHRWSDPAGILKQAGLVVVRRDTRESIVEIADRVANRLQLTLEWHERNRVAEISGHSSRIDILDTVTSTAASSEIKFRLRQKTALPHGWIPQAVIEFIESHHLYEGG